ncbi:Augmenter of liver regeneration, putative [Pediculus humanus corporis]|uniref:Sulfhydryl oxidase n=1 Tax=Pediculus humanus subsp. corporis TaxID=121224 RepID=E0VYU4_PEDHC|nr:Augmenter of liver regeneration, putative [Pediculus humanus corporis]EEB18550.1 Augmenter of liver regeneration, putative [Pediculus humanus corporis]
MAGPKENVIETHEKPCRACTDFKTWAKLKNNVKKEETNGNTQESVGITNSNCPLTKDELGRQTWGFLHTMAAYYPDNPTDEQKNDVHQFMKLFSRFYPCSVCAEDLQQQIERFPPKTESQYEFSQWLCRIHNRINLRLGKPLFDCNTVNERWRDGWKDGSCD